MTEQEIRARALECATTFLAYRAIGPLEDLLRHAATLESYITDGLDTAIIRIKELTP